MKTLFSFVLMLIKLAFPILVILIMHLVSVTKTLRTSLRELSPDTPVFKDNTSPGDSLYFLDPDGHKLEIHVGNWSLRIEAKKKDGAVPDNTLKCYIRDK